EQSAVWRQVDEELTRSSLASRTRSYEAYLQGVKKRLVAAAQRAAVRPPIAANGAAIFPRCGGFWIEAYPVAEALVQHTDELLCDLFDPGQDGSAELPAEGDLDRLLAAVWEAPLHMLDRVAGTIGESFAMSDGPSYDGGHTRTPGRAAGAVLLLDG